MTSMSYDVLVIDVHDIDLCDIGRSLQKKQKGIAKRDSLILDSSMVEHSAVNRVVVGSSPTRGAKFAAEAAAKS